MDTRAWWILPGILIVAVAVSRLPSATRRGRPRPSGYAAGAFGVPQRKRWRARVCRRTTAILLASLAPHVTQVGRPTEGRGVLIEVGANNERAAQAVATLPSRPAASTRVDEKSLDLGSAEDAVRRWLRDCTAWTVSRAEFLREARDHVKCLQKSLPDAQQKHPRSSEGVQGNATKQPMTRRR